MTNFVGRVFVLDTIGAGPRRRVALAALAVTVQGSGDRTLRAAVAPLPLPVRA